MNAEGIAVIIPALDEEEAIPGLIEDLSGLGLLGSALVVDNGSRDATAARARSAGCRVVVEPRRGYGAACLRGIREIEEHARGIRVVVFLDADRSDDPQLIPSLVEPISSGGFDMVIGSRAAGISQPGAIPLHQRAGNRLVCAAIRVLFGHRFTDIGPFRAVRLDALRSLGMQDRSFGWTTEMQVKAVLKGLRVKEIPVSYRRRVGTSKISGTFSGSARAALRIGWTLAAMRLKGP